MRTITLIQNYWHKLLTNPLLVGSVIMFVGANVHNAGQLLYHYLAINLLSRAHYGDLAAMIAIFSYLGIVQQSLGLSVVKFIASEKDEKESHGHSKAIFFWSIWVAGAMALIILTLAPLISKFLQIGQPGAVYLFAPVVFITFVTNTGRSLLQGVVRFFQLATSMIVEVLVKIISTIVLVKLGYELFGAVIGLLIGAAVGLGVVWLSLKDNLKGARKTMLSIVPLLKYSLPVMVQSIAMTAMYSTDIILVKHFFQPDIAGSYAALSKFGTIALFVSSPIATVMFPLVAKKHSHGEPYHKVFYLSLASITIISSVVVIIYKLFGSLIADTLTKGKYVEESYLLWWFGLYMLLLGVAVLFTQFYLSIGQTKTVWLFAIAAILQVVLIWFFHSELVSIIQSSVVSAALLVLCLSIYFLYHDHK
ncbi:MAG: hypothetical protein A3H88_03550 [Candidatus Blackburnbacteria bacterium RIFCSPLOWO2_02_FULL_44_9]|uniref:Polysaccharide biosynthesis protein C-terminal domain-containing protein n=1 Tax=Candidatus Blackburnbacteria bacterium RIFCSPHIGHO2_02_FULL_44_20 TaxID=1797516 RepID=A0A1G1V8P3_9BACT|nr:MAG: hypothetical protein A3E16_01035 [Candidatus Blackburnbacteria bacterium RIFCSPHIGHO2_12_FULL_44_25]OGY11790.1 MAG: hypothetical protein A3D26_01630 [Candidatus Blackburnbacteria bacterium RIFCSPHIGHO2_02_FULL_44_20]OGY15620.1 MAG: hypothetical protein A3H88_03550 [Candidatus Blackburnbacteria bacterium RIFCSPLOWO2_02_FULL_44_9]